MATTKKKPAAKKTTHKKAAAHQPQRSFRVAKPTTPFFHFDFTVQTIYWLIIGALAISMALWVMTLNMQVQDLYDKIDQNSQAIMDSTPTSTKSTY